MRRRIFLALILGVALLGAWTGARAVALRQQATSDRIPLEEFKALLADKKPVFILDVRNDVESKIKGAAHIPLDQLESRLSEVPRDREIITYCS